MAGSIIPKATKTRSRRRSQHPPMADINVTPMVDVMLVLLIIFMVAAPLLTVGVPINLPKTQARNLSETTPPLTVSIDQNGRIFVYEKEVALDQLVGQVRSEMQSRSTDQVIFIRGDKNVNYGQFMAVMGILASSGFNKLSLIAEAPSHTK